MIGLFVVGGDFSDRAGQDGKRKAAEAWRKRDPALDYDHAGNVAYWRIRQQYRHGSGHAAHCCQSGVQRRD